MTEKRRDGGDQLDKLILFAQGKLDPSEHDAIKAEIGTNPGLRALYSFVRAASEVREHLSVADITAASKQTGMQIFRDFQKLKSSPSSKQAITLFDSRNMPLPEGVRPAAVDTRSLKYQLPEGVVELAVYPISIESFEVLGMILEHESAGPFDIVIRSGRREMKFKTDEVNLFRIPRIQRGRHEIRILVDSKLIGSFEIEL